LLASLVGALLLAGCDLLDEATSVTVCTEEEQFELDATQITLGGSLATVPEVPCSDQNDPCDDLGAVVSCDSSGFVCSVSCDTAGGGASACQLEASFEAFTDVDLSEAVQSGVQSRAMDKVTVERVEYTVPTNTLNLETPQITFYVGPATADNTADPAVVLLGRLPPIPAGTTLESTTLPLDEAGRVALTQFVRDYETPFRMFAVADVTVEGGQAVPDGNLELLLKGCFKINLL
jgi:hypothetical protein